MYKMQCLEIKENRVKEQDGFHRHIMIRAREKIKFAGCLKNSSWICLCHISSNRVIRVTVLQWICSEQLSDSYLL